MEIFREGRELEELNFRLIRRVLPSLLNVVVGPSFVAEPVRTSQGFEMPWLTGAYCGVLDTAATT
jgi:hypothetical protein